MKVDEEGLEELLSLDLLLLMWWESSESHMTSSNEPLLRVSRRPMDPPTWHLIASPSLMICLAATAEERWMGSMKMLSVSASETIEYLKEEGIMWDDLGEHLNGR